MIREDLEQIVDAFLRDLLKKLAHEANRNIRYSLIDIEAIDERLEGYVESEGATEDSTVEIRVIRRQSTRPTRFTLQALTDDLSPETGYSGFVAKGRLIRPTGVEILSRANRYNMFSWDKQLELTEAN
jgi:hypothetical protein